MNMLNYVKKPIIQALETKQQNFKRFVIIYSNSQAIYSLRNN